MKDLSEIKRAVASFDGSDRQIYLIERLSPKCGLFAYKNKLCFLCTHSSERTAGEQTRHLEFLPNVLIKQIANDSSFSSGYYDLLLLKRDADDALLESFLRIVRLYATNDSLPLDAFVSSLSELFRVIAQEDSNNGVGLFGELSFLTEALKRKIELCDYWHLSGPFSNTDFASKDYSADVKTTLSYPPKVPIRHYQLFDGTNRGIIVVVIKLDDSGRSLVDLFKFLEDSKETSANVRFQIALAKEKRKRIDSKELEKRYSVVGYFGFESARLDTIGRIPLCVSDINYRYEFDIEKACDPFELLKERFMPKV